MQLLSLWTLKNRPDSYSLWNGYGDSMPWACGIGEGPRLSWRCARDPVPSNPAGQVEGPPSPGGHLTPGAGCPCDGITSKTRWVSAASLSLPLASDRERPSFPPNSTPTRLFLMAGIAPPPAFLAI